ncbi:WD repeat-containing protein 49 isoform X2 [Electrophorus electricus]|uniref:WD repeat-containing protein 49 isoform X2 n=1 Tax=Electrophorus electricus TaxID=8005 RepID=UPI0015D0B2FF|nr:WD repeat-containing protein 49 isoform X2 [Electrophorus electricus]
MATAKEAELLECRLSVEDLKKLQRLFLQTDGSSVALSMRRAEFIEQAWAAVGHGSREEYGDLFDSVDVSREGWVDWEHLASFLLLGLFEKEEHARTAAVPRWRPARTLPATHGGPVQSVAHLGTSGRYLSASKEGTLAVWSEDLTLLKTHRLANDSVMPKDLWVTGMVLLANVNKIAVSFTCKEVCFYDLLSKQEFSCQYKVHSLCNTPISLHYWHHPQRPEQAVLSIGDVAGQVSGLCFRSALISLFERPSMSVEHDSVVSISWAELQQGRHRCCYTVTHTAHGAHWVRTVRFLGPLEAFASCSSASQSSLVLAWKEVSTGPLRVTSFHTEKGLADLDYHPGLNLIATAGLNNQVCLWNPYVVSKPVGVLRGHVTSVVAVQFMLAKKQLISFSKDKVLRVWDVASQLCLQRLAGIFPKTPECKMLVFFHEERSRLLLSFNSVVLLLQAQEDTGRRVASHDSSVTCVLYNSLFRQVISSDSSSGVTCWLMDTGQKVKHFPRCHGDAEITTMALDETQTRLFTAGTDGAVKVWDFNGHCHHRLNAGRGVAVEISQILVLRRTVLVFGWERMVTVFRLNMFSKYFVEPSEWKGAVHHCNDILCAAFRPPQTLVTGGSDGEIIAWNNSTENALRKLSLGKQQHLLKFSSDSAFCKTSAVQPSTNSSAPGGEEDPESVTRLVFLEGRKGAAASGGADLVSCGGSGMVRFWNTANSCVVGEFVAHKDSGSIILTVDSRGRYLVTADMDGWLKVWDIQEYCIHPAESVTNQMPMLLSSLRAHIDCVTHLETCVHGEQLFLLSASADSSLVISYLPGPTIGIFGQEVHWRLGEVGRATLKEEREANPESSQETTAPAVVRETAPEQVHPDPDSAVAAVCSEAEENDGQADMLQLSILDDRFAVQGRSFKKGHGIWQSDIRQHLYVNGAHSTDIGTFRELRIEELDPVDELTKPDFVINPHLYFEKMWESFTPTPPPPAVTRETCLKAAFDERSLFPKDVLEQVDRPPGLRRYTQKVTVMRNDARAIHRNVGCVCVCVFFSPPIFFFTQS